MSEVITFQGEPGAFSEVAALSALPGCTPQPCTTFEDALSAVSEGTARAAVIPVENSVAGRVADIHHLLPDAGLSIIAEHFEPVRHMLLAPPGVAIGDVKRVRSHPMALAQCRRLIRARGLIPERELDTAAAARLVAEAGEKDAAAIASARAGVLHGLEALAHDIHDDPENTTRFLVMSRTPRPLPAGDEACITSFVFRTRNVPAALYKALGGFATNGVNMTRLESYQVEGGFTASQFFADVEGRPDQPALARALEELQFFSSRLRMLGTYAAHPYRLGRSLHP